MTAVAEDEAEEVVEEEVAVVTWAECETAVVDC